MQRESFEDSTIRGLTVHPSAEADAYKARLLAETSNVAACCSLLTTISGELLRSLARVLPTDGRTLIPITVMRGGILAKPAFEAVFLTCPSGVVAPHRRSSLDTPKITYGNVPIMDGPARYLILDILLATGATVIAVLDAIFHYVPIRDAEVHVAVPMMAEIGIDRVLNAHPTVMLHAVWHKEQVDHQNRMVGPGFDIGDYAFGGPRLQRVEWG